MTLPFDQRDGWMWVNGEIIAWESATAHIINHGLHYGGSVFEGIRAYNGKPFKLNEHNERLIKSGDLIGMTIPYTAAELNQACMDIMTLNNLSDCYLRPVAWRGSEEMGIGAPGASTQVAIAAWEWGLYFNNDEGISLQTTHWRKPAPDTSVTSSKCAAGYVIGTMAKHDSLNAGYNDALMLDYRGYVAECTAANLFMAKDGVIYTPIPDCFLNGITRLTAIDMAKDAGIEVIEKHIMPDELMQADEIFVTGTAAEIVPVSKIDQTSFPVGPISKQMIADYKKITGQI